MVYRIDGVVTEIIADFDPYGGEYVRVAIGFKLPVPRPPEAEKVYPPPPKPVVYKHAAHIFIPRDQWVGQYTMWQEYTITVKDNGEVEIKRKEREK